MHIGRMGRFSSVLLLTLAACGDNFVDQPGDTQPVDETPTLGTSLAGPRYVPAVCSTQTWSTNIAGTTAPRPGMNVSVVARADRAVSMATPKGEEFPARLNAINGTTLKKLDIKTGGEANAIKAAIEKGDFRVVSIDKKGVKRNPYAPFATSTLQMDASRKLGFSAKQTMQVAQRLYEGVDIGGETVGLITYMRTDGVTIVPEAISSIRGLIAREYSQKFVAPFIREYKTKAKNAQEAHEAIRPTEVSRKPQDVAKYLEKDQARLYELIWKRAVASQMASAELEQTTAEITVPGRDGKAYGLRATGSVVLFEGFLKLYEEGRDDRARNGKAEETDEDDSRRLPPLAQGDGCLLYTSDAADE